MRFTIAAAAAALVAGASATYNNGTVYVTEVVSDYTTYCPYATSISHNGVTYTVSEATTLTITNCPCTITHPVSSTPAAPVSAYGSSTAAVATTPAASSAPVASSSAPAVSSSAPAGYPYHNGTATTSSGAAAGTGSPATTSAPAAFTGAASAVQASGAGLAAILALAAYAL